MSMSLSPKETDRTPLGKLVFPDESYQIVGACFEAYNELGSGFLEAVYQEALGIEFQEAELPALAQLELRLQYKQHHLETTYRPDFICFGKIVVELKAVQELVNEHRAQVHNYLKATGYRLGILVNFGQYPKLVYERIVR